MSPGARVRVWRRAWRPDRAQSGADRPRVRAHRLRLTTALLVVVTGGTVVACSPGDEGGSGDALADVTPPLVAAPPEDAAPPDPWAGSPEDREAVVGVAEGVLRAINEADGVLMQGLLTDGATVSRITRGGSGESGVEGAGVSTIGRAEFVQGISDPAQGFVERMWDPRVRIDGDLATVWAPYDFYVSGAFSHCGIDTFQLVRTPRGWRVHGLVYTVARPPACETHPEGAPGN